MCPVFIYLLGVLSHRLDKLAAVAQHLFWPPEDLTTLFIPFVFPSGCGVAGEGICTNIHVGRQQERAAGTLSKQSKRRQEKNSKVQREGKRK